MISKLREIDALMQWPSSFDFRDDKSFHIPVARFIHKEYSSVQKIQYFTINWNSFGQNDEFNFIHSIVHEGVKIAPYYAFGNPTNEFCERISSISFQRIFLNTIVQYLESYMVTAERRTTLVKERSKCEEAFLQILDKYFKDCVFIEQVPFKNQFTNAINYIDFAYEPKKIAIELDGRQYHDPAIISRESWEYQVKRDRALKLLGWTVLRFTCKEIFQTPNQVSRDIRKAFTL